MAPEGSSELKRARKKYLKDLQAAGLALRSFSDASYAYALDVKDAQDSEALLIPLDFESEGFALRLLTTGKRGPGRPRKIDLEPKDPNAPKKPPTAYLLFRQAVTEQVDSKTVTGKDLTEMCKTQWKSYSDEEKAPFVDAAEKAKVIYGQDLARYKAGEQVSTNNDIDMRSIVVRALPNIQAAAAALPSAPVKTNGGAADSDDDEEDSEEESFDDGQLIPTKAQHQAMEIDDSSDESDEEDDE